MTTIEWTDYVWNPVRGCALVSAGCANCYAMKQAHRFSGKGRPYEGLTELGPQGPRWNGKITLVPEALDEPLHWKQPRRIFVNSMSDLFHEDVPDEFIDRVFAVMVLTPQHSYQLLTKRPERMRDYTASEDRPFKIAKATHWAPSKLEWPLPNCWKGVSVEDQLTADTRIPILLRTPAAVRWISAEPLLGSVHVAGWLKYWRRGGTVRTVSRGLDWVIAGGEGGPGARPCAVKWIRSIVRQCQEATVPVFVKQLGSYVTDRNDAGFEGDEPASWPWDTDVDDPDNEWHYQGARIRVRLCDRKGGDPSEWPADLRVREWPR